MFTSGGFQCFGKWGRRALEKENLNIKKGKSLPKAWGSFRLWEPKTKAELEGQY